MTTKNATQEEVTQVKQSGRGKGFASLSAERKHEIASKGGRAAHANGTAHKFKTGSKEASDAGKKGGSVRRKKKQEQGA